MNKQTNKQNKLKMKVCQAVIHLSVRGFMLRYKTLLNLPRGLSVRTPSQYRYTPCYSFRIWLTVEVFEVWQVWQMSLFVCLFIYFHPNFLVDLDFLTKNIYNITYKYLYIIFVFNTLQISLLLFYY